MLSGILSMAGLLILRLVYGKKFSQKNFNMRGLPLVLTVAFIFWLLAILFLFTGASTSDLWFCILYGVGFPAVLIFWGILNRMGAKDNVVIEDDSPYINTNLINQTTSNSGQKEQNEHKAPSDAVSLDESSGRPCPGCGRLIPRAAETCSHCGYTAPKQTISGKYKERPCPMCGKTISSGRAACSHCGYSS